MEITDKYTTPQNLKERRDMSNTSNQPELDEHYFRNMLVSLPIESLILLAEWYGHWATWSNERTIVLEVIEFKKTLIGKTLC